MPQEAIMKTVHRGNRGQVLIIFVFAIVGLIGITGLAIDGGNIYQKRREAQNAADTAALAGGLYKVRQQDASRTGCGDLTQQCGQEVALRAVQVALENGYNNNLIDNTVDVFIPPVDGTYSNSANCANFDCTNYVEVKITSTIQTYFARILGRGTLTNTVWAVALARYRPQQALYGEDALVILAPHAVSGGSGEFVTKGNATVYVHGGNIFVNSDGGQAFTETSGCITFVMDADKSINVVGGAKLDSCATPPTWQHTTAKQFPPDEPFPAEPDECSVAGHSTTDTSGPYNGFTHLYPGYYSTAGSNKFPPDKDTFLDPGVYCIDGLVKTTNPVTRLIGNNVFLYLRKGGQFSFGGGTAQLTAPATGKYAGYLIYAAPDYGVDWRYTTPASCSINAAADDLFTGVIWAPFCDTTLNGGAGTTGMKAKLVVYTLLINGSQILNFYYDVGSNPGVPKGMYISLFH